MKDYAHYKKKSKIDFKIIIILLAFILAYVLASTSDFYTFKNTHSRAFINCQFYYSLPCDDNGELRTDLTSADINYYYEADARHEIQLTDFEIKYLQAIDGKN